MGTRADFYVGRDEKAEWLGSIGWDGYRDGIDDAVLAATSEEEFRAAVAAFALTRDDWTAPEKGWPWPWNDSSISDCSYWFFDNQVWDERNKHYALCSQPIPEDYSDYENVEGLELIKFPDMSHLKNVTLGSRSGLILITPKATA